jgi:hypothetical protein
MLGYQLKTLIMGYGQAASALVSKTQTGVRLSSSNAVAAAKTTAADSTQPAYTMSYQSDRQVASTMAGAGGCGTVRALTSSGDSPFSSGGATVALILLPLLVMVVMRLRAPASRRRFERFKIDSDVRINVGGRELVGSISSISLGGAQVNTSALLQDGGLVTLAITSPGGEEKVEVAGRVVWSEANKAYGVAFDKAPASALSRISDWTKGLQRT